jgi:hypothetical protein
VNECAVDARVVVFLIRRKEVAVAVRLHGNEINSSADGELAYSRDREIAAFLTELLEMQVAPRCPLEKMKTMHIIKENHSFGRHLYKQIFVINTINCFQLLPFVVLHR